MTDSVNDYGPVASLYDSYVHVDFDLPFFVDEAKRVAGPVLELAAGTGRVSESLLKVTPRLTCVDVSRDMLEVLEQKIAGAARLPRTVCADMRYLPFKDCYHLVLIPFNSFLEVTEARDQVRVLSEVWSTLIPGGSLVCTLHNPRVRGRSFGSDERMLGRFDIAESGGSLEVWLRESWNSEVRVAEAEQTYKLFDSMGSLEREQTMRLRFSLIEKDDFAAMARETGFEVAELLGDYDRSPFDAELSPYMIWILRRP